MRKWGTRLERLSKCVDVLLKNKQCSPRGRVTINAGGIKIHETNMPNKNWVGKVAKVQVVQESLILYKRRAEKMVNFRLNQVCCHHTQGNQKV